MVSPQQPVYEIRVEGVLGESWGAWFNDVNVITEGDHTVLQGPLVDEAAVFGVLDRVRDLGVRLVSVQRLDGLPVSEVDQK